jgi:glc operon protein GlcG
MSSEKIQEVILKIIEVISARIPAYAHIPEDWSKCEGNVALCIIDDAGNVHGKIWGPDKLRGRQYFDVAYRKAAQAWITGYATGEYERMIFTEQINYKDFGLELPELIGWKGGQPLALDKDTKIYCGFSGFRGITDISIVKNAVEEVIKSIA